MKRSYASIRARKAPRINNRRPAPLDSFRSMPVETEPAVRIMAPSKQVTLPKIKLKIQRSNHTSTIARNDQPSKVSFSLLRFTRFGYSPSIKCLNSRFPSGQSPRPDSPLICPAGPISTKRLPQERANSLARIMVRYGSLLLATMIDGNGSRSRGTGEKSLSCLGASLPSTSAGATSNAPLILCT